MTHRSVCSILRSALESWAVQLESWAVQLVSVILYIQYLWAPEHITAMQDRGYKLGFITFAAVIAFAIQLAIAMAISLAVAELTRKAPPKARQSQPTGLEQFTVPTAEEGRAMQVLFGKRYIAGPNVVWYGDLKSVPIIVRV